MHHSPSPRRIAAGLALSLALVGTASACGDDDDAATETSAEATSVSAEACDAFVGLSSVLAGDPSMAGGAVTAFTETAPSAVAEDVETMAAAFAALLSEEGSPEVFGEPAFLNASEQVADTYFDGCELAEELAVDGVDYGFEGLPASIDAGRIGLRFTNKTEHDEPHELVLFRKNPGTTESAEELLALPEDESMAKVTMAGVVFADAPGSTAVSMLDLEPGSYLAVCFIPVGGGEDGPPHSLSGMVAEFDAS